MGMFRLLTKAHIIIFLLPALIAKGEAFMFTSWINTQYVYIYIYVFAEEPFILSLILSQILIHVLLLLV